jgi:hypothetical protein
MSGISFSVEYTENPGDIRDVTHFAGGVASGDFDNDGDIDLFVLRGDTNSNLLYRNDGDSTFTDVAEAAGLAFTRSATENWRHSGPAFADMDGDGDLDLFLGGVQTDPSLIFRNEGDGTFSDVTAGSGLDLMVAPQTVSAAFGDYDLDGDVDMFLAHWGTGVLRDQRWTRATPSICGVTKAPRHRFSLSVSARPLASRQASLRCLIPRR